MRPTFFDPDLQADLERDGFVVTPFLDADEVAALRAAYEEVGRAPGDPAKACISTFHSYDAEYKATADARIREVFDRPLAATFDRQRPLPCNFLMKWPGGMSGFGLHQDLTLVDEREHRSVEVWVALTDTDAANGQLWFVPGSHRWHPTLRGIQSFDFPFWPVAQRLINEHAVPVPIEAGQAIVFTHAVLHFSQPNRTEVPRLAVITDLIPEEAAHLHYFGDGEGGVDEYEIDASFWVENNPFTLWKPPPAANRRGKVDWFTYRTFTEDDLERLIAAGEAPKVEHGARGALNAGKPWCHRCGSSDDVEGDVDRWIGNVTMLCGPCAVEERGRAPSPAHVGG